MHVDLTSVCVAEMVVLMTAGLVGRACKMGFILINRRDDYMHCQCNSLIAVFLLFGDPNGLKKASYAKGMI